MKKTMKIELRPQERLDDLIKSGRKIIQNEAEFCFSLDAVLLAHFPKYKKSFRVLDLGTGTGVMPLLIADEVREIQAVEISPVMAELARRNMALNGLAEKIQVQQGDYRRIGELYEAESFDLVLVNPPYRPVNHGQQNAQRDKRSVHHHQTHRLRQLYHMASIGTLH